MEAIVAGDEGRGCEKCVFVVGRLFEIGVDPFGIIVLGSDLGEGVDGLPVQAAEARETKVRLGEGDGAGDDAALVLLEVE